MASAVTKQLGEFLQEQQEPFALDVYLLERGYLRRSRSSTEQQSPCFCSNNPAKLLKRSASSDLKRRRKVIPYCSKMIRAVFNRIAFTSMKIKNSHRTFSAVEMVKGGRESQDVAEEDRFSSASSTTVFNSCSDSDMEDVHCVPSSSDMQLTAESTRALKDRNFGPGKEVVADRNLRQKATEESKQLSPVSVLEAIESGDGSSVHSTKQNVKRREEGPSTSASRCKTEKPCLSRTGDLQNVDRDDSSSHYAKNKKAIQQTKQLLFDCVREVVETHRKKDTRGLHLQGILGPEELWKLICENLSVWSKVSIDETNTTHLLHFDVQASEGEWSGFGEQNQEVCMQIAEAILEDMTREVVSEMCSCVP